MKKKRITAALLCVVLIAGIVGCGVMTNYSRVLNANWGISLPFKALCSEIYEKDSGASFHGDGIRYHVFSYKYEDYIDLMFAWGSGQHSTNYYSTISEATEEWLDKIDVPDEHRPSYSECLSWHRSREDNSEIIFFWDNEKNKLYVVESFI